MPALILPRSGRIGIAVLFAVVLGYLGSLHSVRQAFDAIESRALDAQFLIRGVTPAASLPILLVLVDDPALEPHGFRSPTPRALIADMVRDLSAKGARSYATRWTSSSNRITRLFRPAARMNSTVGLRRPTSCSWMTCNSSATAKNCRPS